MISKWQFLLSIVTVYTLLLISNVIGLVSHLFYWLLFDGFGRAEKKSKKRLERTSDDRDDEYYAIIIGAGFSGLGTGIQLKERGMDNFLIFERHSHVGGTWYANKYPGCAVDVVSNLYSYSFEPNPQWSHYYSPRSEIENYLERCTDKYDIRSHIQFNTIVIRCDWLDDRQVWKVTIMRKDENEKQSFYSRILVGAYGLLSDASYPKNIDGIETFQGQMCHTAEWNKQIDFKQKRVAVVGTGSSAIQLVPELHKHFDIEHLYVFQRTAPWIIPLPNRLVTSFEKRLLASIPFVQKFIRAWVYWKNEFYVLSLVHRWPIRWLLDYIYSYLRFSQVKDEQLRIKVTPKFDFGCKRVLFSNDWYPTLQKSNVTLVTNRIKAVTPHSIVTYDGDEYPVDIIIWSTGFQVHSLHVPMYGLQGRSLAEQWSESAQAYRGVTVPNFPNLFLLLGPNSALGHTSVLIMIESQINYFIEALIYMAEHQIRAVSVKSNIADEFNHDIQSKLKTTVWNQGGCHSWYLDAKGNNTTLWPGFTWTYNLLLRNFDHQNYHLISS